MCRIEVGKRSCVELRDAFGLDLVCFYRRTHTELVQEIKYAVQYVCD